MNVNSGLPFSQMIKYNAECIENFKKYPFYSSPQNIHQAHPQWWQFSTCLYLYSIVILREGLFD